MLQGKKEKKRREKKSGKELLQIGEPEEQLSFFEELEQEVSNKDPSVLTLCGMPWFEVPGCEKCCFDCPTAWRPLAPAVLLQLCIALLAGHVLRPSCMLTACFGGAQKGAIPKLDTSSFPRMPAPDGEPDLGPGESPLWDLLTSMKTGALQ